MIFFLSKDLKNFKINPFSQIGKAENVKAAQDALLLRARSNSEAALGKFEYYFEKISFVF